VGVGHQAGQRLWIERGECSLRCRRGIPVTYSGRPFDRNKAWMPALQPSFRSRAQSLEEWLADRIEHSAASTSAARSSSHALRNDRG